MNNIVCGRCPVSQIIIFRRCIFIKKMFFFCHLKLEIASAIPASNDEKYNKNNSAVLIESPVVAWNNFFIAIVNMISMTLWLYEFFEMHFFTLINTKDQYF